MNVWINVPLAITQIPKLWNAWIVIPIAKHAQAITLQVVLHVNPLSIYLMGFAYLIVPLHIIRVILQPISAIKLAIQLI